MKKQFIIPKTFLVEAETPMTLIQEGIEVLFTIFFKFGYYLLISPFKIVKIPSDKSLPTYKLHTAKVQQVKTPLSDLVPIYKSN